MPLIAHSYTHHNYIGHEHAGHDSAGAIDRQRMVFHLLLGATEDLPFCFLNFLLVLVPRRDNLLCDSRNPGCRAYLNSQGQAEAPVLLLCLSIAALTYKATQLMLFQAVWKEQKQMKREEEELDERETELFASRPVTHRPSESTDSPPPSPLTLPSTSRPTPSRPPELLKEEQSSDQLDMDKKGSEGAKLESAEMAMLKREIKELQRELEEMRRHSKVLEEVARAPKEAGSCVQPAR